MGKRIRVEIPDPWAGITNDDLNKEITVEDLNLLLKEIQYNSVIMTLQKANQYVNRYDKN